MSDVFQEMELAAQRDSKDAEIERLRARLAEAERLLRDAGVWTRGLRSLGASDVTDRIDAFLAGEKP